MPNNDSHQHVVKTSAQWNDRAVEYWIVPRGCLCIELTSKGKTKIKVGEGNKYYAQLPYITSEADLTQYYTKEEINILFENLNRMAIMSTDEYDDKDDLPLDGNKLGDVRFVKSSSPSIKIDPDIYLWNGTKWIFVGYEFKDVDLSKYLKKEEFHELFDPVKEKVDEMYPKMHTHSNKAVLDQITAPFTVPEKEKLAGLENYDDTEIRELIHESSHTHPNKDVLDTITTNSLWSQSDRDKFDNLHNYDDGPITERVEDLEDKAHTHTNKEFLDTIVMPYQIWSQEDREKFDSLSNPEVFIGTDGQYPGRKGLVPAPAITDIGKFLSSSGHWLSIESATDFVGATIDTNGIHGLVPAPMAGQEDYFLKADGTWAEVSSSSDIEYRGGDGIDIIDNSNSINYIRFEITKIRNNNQNVVQYSEIEFYDENSGRLAIQNATAIFSDNTEPVYGQYASRTWSPNDVIDNDTSTKLCVTNWSRVSLYTDLHLTVPIERVNLKSYRWYTADDSPERDPISWRLFISPDGETWELVDTQNDVEITNNRQAALPIFQLDIESNPVIKYIVNTGLLSVEQDEEDPNHLIFETSDGDVDITIPGGGEQYSAGDGIDISNSGSEIIVTNPAYYFDTQVQCEISGRTFTKYNTDPALGVIVYNQTGYTGPLFIGLTEDSVKIRQSHDSSIIGCRGSFEYLGYTWYYSNNGYWMSGNWTDSLGNIEKLQGSYPMTTDAEMAILGQLIVNTAGVIPSGQKIISTKIGNGLMFDEDDAIRTTAIPANYVADDGIEFTQTIPPPTVDDWTADNAGYYFDNQVTCYLSRSYKKTYDGPALCCVMNMIRNGDPIYDMFLVSPVLRNVTFECNGNVFVPSSSNYIMYKGLKWYYSNWDYAWGGTSGSDTSGNLISLPLAGGTPPTTFADAALLLLQTADVIGVEHGAPTYAVSAKLGDGLQFDANGAIETVSPIDDVEYVARSNTLTISKLDGSTVDVPVGGGGTTYEAGDGINIRTAGSEISEEDVFTGKESLYINEAYYDRASNSHIPWPKVVQAIDPGAFTTVKSNDFAIEAFDTNDEPLWVYLNFFNDQDEHFWGTDCLISGTPDKLSNYNPYDAMISKVSACICRLPDGSTEYHDEDRIDIAPNEVASIVIKWLSNDDIIEAKLGDGLTFDQNDAITIDESIKIILNCDNDN